jgi:hypothetical protein
MLWARGSPKLSAAACLQDLNFLRKITKWGRPPCLSYALSSLKRAGHALVMSAPKKVGGGGGKRLPGAALWELAFTGTNTFFSWYFFPFGFLNLLYTQI